MVQEYDAIIIGSGMGSMSFASLYAQFKNKRVLMLESHFKMGGHTHSFSRKGYQWDVGLHYIGDMAPESVGRKIFDKVTGNALKWNALPDIFDIYNFPGLTFKQAKGLDRFEGDLLKLFPNEEMALKQYKKDVIEIGKLFPLEQLAPFDESFKQVCKTLCPVGLKTRYPMSAKQYFDNNFKDEKLKAILCAQWGNYGMSPEIVPFILHAGLVNHYAEGAFFPAGGSERIAQSVAKIITENGGSVKLSEGVVEIIIESGKAIGVRTEKQNTFMAPLIISGVGVHNTYTRLLPEHSKTIPIRMKINKLLEQQAPVSTVSVYLGLKKDPQSLGFGAENHWIYRSFDHHTTFKRRKSWPFRAPTQAFLCFPSKKRNNQEKHCAEIISLVDAKLFDKWKGSEWKKRSEDYNAFKNALANQLIRFIEETYPGFKSLIDFFEVSTPLTNQTFTQHYKGAIYGLPFTKDKLHADMESICGPKTPYSNLYLTGVDIFSPGVMGGLLSGVVTASAIDDSINTRSLWS